MAGTDVLAVDGLTVRYGATTAVAGITQGLAQGDVLGIVGPSGCGKTTFLKALTGFVMPSDGEIYFRGERIFTPATGFIVREPWLRRRVGLVWQNDTLLPYYTVLTNLFLAFGSIRGGPDRAARCREVLAMLNFPRERLETLLDQYPDQLSGGERQRVQLARTLLREPDVLLLDEITANLDPVTTKEITKALWGFRERNPNVAVILVTHLMDFLNAFADRAVYMEDGYVVEEVGRKPVLENFAHQRAQKFVTAMASGDDVVPS